MASYPFMCQSDVGGQRTLQRRWTTFAKAQLLCQADNELPYNVIQDMDTLPPAEGAPADDTLFYGIFNSQWSVSFKNKQKRHELYSADYYMWWPVLPQLKISFYEVWFKFLPLIVVCV